METLPPEFVLQNVPLMAVTGLPVAPESTSDQPLDSKAVIAAAMLARNQTAVWDSAQFFHVVLWTKDKALPPRKTIPPPSNRPIGPTTHSILSPLNAASSLHPDGIISPAWVRKHREDVPSVIVGFYDMVEARGEDRRDPLGAQAASSFERERDGGMIAEINEKRKNAQDRGIKFAIVLILQSNPNDIPNLEDRITYIRRGCSLDTKYALFILSPASCATPADVQEFVTTLQRQLHEHAVNYYREHGKRIKKKKAKLPVAPIRPIATSPSNQSMGSLSGAPTPKPLNPMGWSVRYDYKMGVFAEFRQDFDNAIRHYEGAYQGLVDMFHSTLSGGLFAPGGGSSGNDVLHPFTPRWAEARVLVDSINLKICKISLYTDNPLPALQQLHKHISNFRGLPEFAANVTSTTTTASKVFGLSHLTNVAGGGSFEYWAWVSKQYRIFAELVKIATSKIGLKLPHPPPGSVANANNNPASAAQSLINTISNTGINVISGGEVPIGTFGPFSASNPHLFVQHAGYYYLTAARCAEERMHRFREADQVTSSSITPLLPSAAAAHGVRSHTAFQPSTQPPSTTSSFTSQSLAEERKVDHGAQIVELLSKSYEQFKSQKASRMTFFLACDIARCYESMGRQDMTLSFLSRIKKTYRTEDWPEILRNVLRTCVRCARGLAMREVVVESVVEMLSSRVCRGVEERDGLVDELIREVDSVRSDGERMRVAVDMGVFVAPFLGVGVQFRKANGYVGTSAAFQVVVAGDGATSPPRAMRFKRIRVTFSKSSFDQVWVDDETVAPQPLGPRRSATAELVDCGTGLKVVDDPDPLAPTAVAGSPAADFAEMSIRRVWSTSADLQIVPGVRKVFESTVMPSESQDIKIAMVTLVFEVPNGTLYLNYKISERREDTVSRRRWLTPNENARKPMFLMLDGFGEQSSVRVIRRQPNLSITLHHNPPGLLDEVYPVTLEIMNEETEAIHASADLEFKSSLIADASDATSHISLVAGDIGSTQQQGPLKNVSIGTINPGQRLSLPIHIRAVRTQGERVLNVMIIYRLASDAPSGSSTGVAAEGDFRRSETLRIVFSKPFEARWEARPLSGPSIPCGVGGGGEVGLLSMESLEVGLVRDERWTVVGSVRCVGVWDVEVESVEISGRAAVVGVDVLVQKIYQQSGDYGVWKTGHYSNFGYIVSVSRSVMGNCDSVNVGNLTLRWRRRRMKTENLEDGWVVTNLKIPTLTLSTESVWAQAEIPPHIEVGEPFTVTYVIHNASAAVADLASHVDPSESFVYSGLRRCTFRVLPLSSHTLNYTCVALVAGRCTLPRLHVHVRVLPSSPVGGGGGSQESLVDGGIAVEGEEVAVLVGGSAAGEVDGALVVFVRPRTSASTAVGR